MKKKLKKNKNFNKNQKSFYFEDYIETNLKQKDRSKSSSIHKSSSLSSLSTESSGLKYSSSDPISED